MVYSASPASAPPSACGSRIITSKAGGPGSACTRRAASGTRCPPTTTPTLTCDAYIEAAGIAGEKKTPLFRSAAGKTQKLTDRPMDPNDALRMIKRRAKAVGLSDAVCNHTFRATGITAYRENGGTLEQAQEIANHASPKTTKLYDRTSDQITLDEVERITI